MYVNKPLISVVVPVYNAAPFLRRTVDSIRQQSYDNLEIILVDDGSRDDSYAICQQLAKEDERICCFSEENGGAARARNYGIRQAHGEYIGFVDSDDLIMPDMYECLLQGAQQLQSQGLSRFVVQIGRQEVDEAGNVLPDAVIPPAEPLQESAMEFAESLLLYTGDASFCTSLVPAAYIKEHFFPEGAMGEDFRLLMEMANGDRGRRADASAAGTARRVYTGHGRNETDHTAEGGLQAVLRLPQRGYRVVHRRGSATRRAAPSQFSRVYEDIVRHADYVEQQMVPAHPQLAVPAKRFALYERLDYLLHVPIPDMTKDNQFYQDVCDYLHANFHEMLHNPYLSSKNKLYLILLTIAPRKTRQIHWALRRKAIMRDAAQ